MSISPNKTDITKSKVQPAGQSTKRVNQLLSNKYLCNLKGTNLTTQAPPAIVLLQPLQYHIPTHFLFKVSLKIAMIYYLITPH